MHGSEQWKVQDVKLVNQWTFEKDLQPTKTETSMKGWWLNNTSTSIAGLVQSIQPDIKIWDLCVLINVIPK